MDPNQIPKGAGQIETPVDGRAPNPPGVYEHKEAGVRIIAMPDAKSTAQQDALVRMGFVRVADAPTRVELKKMQDAQAKKDAELEKKGIMPGITADPNAPKFNPTSKLGVVEANEQLEAERAARIKAEEELAAMKASQAEKPSEPTPAETPAPEVPEATPESEAQVAEAPAEETPAETPSEESAPSEEPEAKK